VTYYVALPFVQTDTGIAVGQAMECPNEPAALRRAEIMARSPAYVGALAFTRTGNPSLGNFRDATVLRTFGIVPDKRKSARICAYSLCASDGGEGSGEGRTAREN
jgi:hypothetical protein